MTETKRCPHCGQTLPLSSFHRDKRRKDGHSVWCRECRNAAGRRHHLARQTEIKALRARHCEPEHSRMEHRYHLLRDAAWLRQQYLGEFKTTTEIALEIGCAEQTARRALREWGIAGIPKALHAALRAGKQRVQA